MPNDFNAPEVSPTEVARRMTNQEDFQFVDVREAEELEIAAIEGALHLPLSTLRDLGEAGIPAELQDKDVDAVIFCKMGGRSAKITAWLMERGYTNVKSMEGGTNGWSKDVDPSVQIY
jgi:rhodanese-related sulfurtransferase